MGSVRTTAHTRQTTRGAGPAKGPARLFRTLRLRSDLIASGPWRGCGPEEIRPPDTVSS